MLQHCQPLLLVQGQLVCEYGLLTVALMLVQDDDCGIFNEGYDSVFDLHALATESLPMIAGY